MTKIGGYVRRAIVRSDEGRALANYLYSIRRSLGGFREDKTGEVSYSHSPSTHVKVIPNLPISGDGLIVIRGTDWGTLEAFSSLQNMSVLGTLVEVKKGVKILTPSKPYHGR
ncbi:MAG: hypothetical protein WCP89_00895 [archaeon]